MPVKKLKEFLDSNHVRYVSISHSAAYTAQEIAASAHVSGKELAKTVMVKIDGKMAMAVLPASFKVDLEHLKEALGATAIELASEREFRDLFPGCETGGMPPFGNLYDLDVYVSGKLAEDQEIAFNAGSHTELLKLAYADFERLVRPKVVHFAAGRE
jgi:Ala-tRNA(Pro) deacylase